MNMLFDYGKDLIKNNMDKPEIWAAMAHDFLDDPDAQPDKSRKVLAGYCKH